MTLFTWIWMAAVLFIATVSAKFLESSEKEREQYEINGIQCKKCPPGTRLVAHCTENGDESKCEPCEEGFYQSNYTRATRCAECDTCDSTTQTKVKKCTKVRNTQCSCKEGFQLQKKGGEMNIEHCIKDEDVNGTNTLHDTGGVVILVILVFTAVFHNQF